MGVAVPKLEGARTIEARGPLCARATGEGPLYRSSDTLSVAVAWGKKLCTFCHDRLSSSMKHQLADTGLHFVPHTRLITAALAQHLSKAQGGLP